VIDVTTLEPFSKVTCPHCGEAVRVRRTFDHFSIQRGLGEGGMSRVFDAEDSTLGRHVALKILNRHYSKDSVRMASFEREAQLTAAVTHPNVVKLYSIGRDQGNFYIAMELVGGGSLEQRITEKERLSEREALHVGRCVAEGLRAAYREGLIHRDVKPANILFTEDDTPRIVDFGLALFHERDVDDSGEIWATPYYVAPEKVRDDREDFRSDMFSLGATLYHALTGKPPHKANTNSIQELKVIKSRAVKLEDSGFKFSPRTCELINTMLALKPEDRHQSYDDLVEAFRDAESLLGYSVISQRSRRQKLTYGIIGASVATILLAVLVRPSSQPEVKTINLTEGVDQESLTELGKTLLSGSESVAEVFLRARGILTEGKFEEAGKMFGEIANSKNTKQPTLNWARYNAALCAMVAGKKDVAETYFRKIKSDADQGLEVGGMEFKDFFAKLGERMSTDLGIGMARNQVAYETETEEVLGYLAHGLAQWHFGKPRAAREWFMTFRDASPRKGLEWIGAYKKLIDPYLDDVQLAESLGESGKEPYATLEDARKAQTDTKLVLSKLKTQGSLRNQLNKKLQFTGEEINRLKRLAEETERVRLNALRERELVQLNDLTDGLPALVRGYDYSHALELLEGMRFQTPEVQSAMSSKLYLYSKANEFMETLMSDVNARGYLGTLPRRNGMPLQGRLSKLDYANATFALERGQVSIPTDSLSPDGLVNMAQVIAETISDSTDYYRRMELIVVFAKMQGLEQLSMSVAGQLMEENRAFRQRWARVEQSGL
jgi:eukaryotic-like serine/threonine-protein kinase